MLSNLRRSEQRFTLPIGFVERGHRRRAVHLRRLEGGEQQRLIDTALEGPLEAAASRTLAIYVARLGERHDPEAADFDSLTFADRHSLIAHLLIVNQKPEISTVVDCERCAAQLELALDLRGIRLRAHDPRRPLILRSKGEMRSIRLPAPHDLQSVKDPLDVVAACLACSRDDAQRWQHLAERVFAAYDPLAQIEVTGRCTACGTLVSSSADLVEKWLALVSRRASELIGDVHALASHYHWSENDILALPPARREAYIDLCWAT